MQQFKIERSTHVELAPDFKSVTQHYFMAMLGKFGGEDAISDTRLLEHDERFSKLCCEHEACSEAIERLGNSKYDEALRAEFSALRDRVETELARYLSEQRRNVGRR